MRRALRDKNGGDAEGRMAERKGKPKGKALGRGLQPGEAARSPIQALQASVKKAAAKKQDKSKTKAGRKSRR
jgi:hypothetical protein